MFNPVRSIMRAATRDDSKPLNILTFCTHERFETGLAKTGHNFYAWRRLDGSIKDWNETYAKLPKNYKLFNPNYGDQQIPLNIDFDLVLTQNKFGQYQIGKDLANRLKLPLVSLEHTLPVPTWDANMLLQLKQMSGNINVFISKFSREAWGWGEDEAEVIEHGIDTDLFCPDFSVQRKKTLLSVNNDWINREWCLNFSGWQRITQGLPVTVVGDTPGLSKPAKDIQDLVRHYQSAYVFLNTTTYSPVPTALLESMACGCAPVSMATCLIPDIIENGKNGFISNDEKELRYYCNLLLNDEELCRKIGVAARETIIERFNEQQFVDKWNEVFLTAITLS